MLSCYHGVQGKDAFYLTPRRMIQVSILMMVSFKGNSRSYVLGCKYSLTIIIYSEVTIICKYSLTIIIYIYIYIYIFCSLVWKLSSRPQYAGGTF